MNFNSSSNSCSEMTSHLDFGSYCNQDSGRHCQGSNDDCTGDIPVSARKRPPRPRSGVNKEDPPINNNISNNIPISTKEKLKNAAKIANDFGSGNFVVASTHEKVRFYPKKKVELTPEQQKEKDRKERRELAMARLQQKAEERMARAEKTGKSKGDSSGEREKTADAAEHTPTPTSSYAAVDTVEAENSYNTPRNPPRKSQSAPHVKEVASNINAGSISTASATSQAEFAVNSNPDTWGQSRSSSTHIDHLALGFATSSSAPNTRQSDSTNDIGKMSPVSCRKRPPRPRSGVNKEDPPINNNISNNIPISTKEKLKNAAKIANDFGSGNFVVASTHEKVRFYPKKKVELAPEQQKEKERKERRELAMARLQQKAEERMARAEKLRKLKLKQQILKEAEKKKNEEEKEVKRKQKQALRDIQKVGLNNISSSCSAPAVALKSKEVDEGDALGMGETDPDADELSIESSECDSISGDEDVDDVDDDNEEGGAGTDSGTSAFDKKSNILGSSTSRKDSIASKGGTNANMNAITNVVEQRSSAVRSIPAPVKQSSKLSKKKVKEQQINKILANIQSHRERVKQAQSEASNNGSGSEKVNCMNAALIPSADAGDHSPTVEAMSNNSVSPESYTKAECIRKESPVVLGFKMPKLTLVKGKLAPQRVDPPSHSAIAEKSPPPSDVIELTSLVEKRLDTNEEFSTITEAVNIPAASSGGCENATTDQQTVRTSTVNTDISVLDAHESCNCEDVMRTQVGPGTLLIPVQPANRLPNDTSNGSTEGIAETGGEGIECDLCVGAETYSLDGNEVDTGIAAGIEVDYCDKSTPPAVLSIASLDLGELGQEKIDIPPNAIGDGGSGGAHASSVVTVGQVKSKVESYLESETDSEEEDGGVMPFYATDAAASAVPCISPRGAMVDDTTASPGNDEMDVIAFNTAVEEMNTGSRCPAKYTRNESNSAVVADVTEVSGAEKEDLLPFPAKSRPLTGNMSSNTVAKPKSCSGNVPNASDQFKVLRTVAKPSSISGMQMQIMENAVEMLNATPNLPPLLKPFSVSTRTNTSSKRAGKKNISGNSNSGAKPVERVSDGGMVSKKRVSKALVTPAATAGCVTKRIRSESPRARQTKADDGSSSIEEIPGCVSGSTFALTSTGICENLNSDVHAVPNSESQLNARSEITIAADTESGVMLSDIYTHIAMIFPTSYGASGNVNGSVTSSSNNSNFTADPSKAKGILSNMYMQIQLYDEWFEVMDDYATVFNSEATAGIKDGRDDDLNGEVDSDGQLIGKGSEFVYDGNATSLHYRVKSSRIEVCNIVSDVFANSRVLRESQKWTELPQNLGLGLSWNLLWTWQKPKLNMSHLLIWQRVNHFVDSKQLTRKDLLKKTLQRFTGNTITSCSDGRDSEQFNPGALLRRTNNKLAEFFEIMPQTYILPIEYTQFVRAFQELETRKQEAAVAAESNGGKDKEVPPLLNYWIMKPIGLSRGRGITLVKDLLFSYSLSSVIQQYVERPLLLDQYKFDLRIYVLVTSFKPLEAFIYKEGFARLSTQQYSINPNDIDNKFIHLTNSSIQKLNADGPSKDNPLVSNRRTGGKSGNYGAAQDCNIAGGNEEDVDHETNGSKIPLTGSYGLWTRLEKQFQREGRIRPGTQPGDIADSAHDSIGETSSSTPFYAEIWKSICLLVLKSLVAVEDKMNHQPCCFEVFGYDVLIDDNLRPWLLEVNASPSLARENQLDVRVKNAMIEDTIRLIDPPQFNRAAVSSILKRRLDEMSKNKFANSKTDKDLEVDLREMLGHPPRAPRRYGEDPRYMGDYQRLAPNTKLYNGVMKYKNKLSKQL